jgi:hypothetical protein
MPKERFPQSEFNKGDESDPFSRVVELVEQRLDGTKTYIYSTLQHFSEEPREDGATLELMNITPCVYQNGRFKTTGDDIESPTTAPEIYKETLSSVTLDIKFPYMHPTDLGSRMVMIATQDGIIAGYLAQSGASYEERLAIEASELQPMKDDNVMVDAVIGEALQSAMSLLASGECSEPGNEANLRLGNLFWGINENLYETTGQTRFEKQDGVELFKLMKDICWRQGESSPAFTKTITTAAGNVYEIHKDLLGLDFIGKNVDTYVNLQETRGVNDPSREPSLYFMTDGRLFYSTRPVAGGPEEYIGQPTRVRLATMADAQEFISLLKEEVIEEIES